LREKAAIITDNLSQTPSPGLLANANNNSGSVLGRVNDPPAATVGSPGCLKELFHLQMLDEDSKLGILFSTKVWLEFIYH